MAEFIIHSEFFHWDKQRGHTRETKELKREALIPYEKITRKKNINYNFDKNDIEIRLNILRIILFIYKRL